MVTLSWGNTQCGATTANATKNTTSNAISTTTNTSDNWLCESHNLCESGTANWRVTSVYPTDTTSTI